MSEIPPLFVPAPPISGDLVQASSSVGSSKSSSASVKTKIPKPDAKFLTDTGLKDVQGRSMPNDRWIDPLQAFHVVPPSQAAKPPPEPQPPGRSKLSHEDLKLAVQRFKTLDRDFMEQINRFFSTNSLMRTIYDIGCRALLGGGIKFEKKHHFQSSMTAKTFDYAWEEFVRDLIKSLWMYGFALCVSRSDSQLVAVPLVLPLDQLVVRFHQDAFGQRHYAVSRPPDNITMALVGHGKDSQFMDLQPGELDSPILGVQVFEMSPPLADGTLTSNVATILDDFRRHDVLMEQYVRFAQYHAVPPVFMRYDLPKGSDATTVRTARAVRDNQLAMPAPSAHGGGAALLNITGDRQAEEYTMDEIEALAMPYVKTGQAKTMAAARLMVQEDLYAAQQLASSSSSAASSSSANLGFQLHQLPPERILDKQLLGKEPGHVEHFHRALEIRVAAVFGIPADLFSEPKGNRSGNTDHRMIYHDAMRGIRQTITTCLYRMYLRIYSTSVSESYIATHNTYNIHQLEADTDVNVTLPGILPTELVTEWRLQGVLDHGTYVSMLARAYSLPKSIFTSKPEVSLKDILKIKPETPGASSSSSSSKSKSSSSSSSSKKSSSSRTSAPKAASSTTTKRRVEASRSAWQDLGLDEDEDQELEVDERRQRKRRRVHFVDSDSESESEAESEHQV